MGVDTKDTWDVDIWAQRHWLAAARHPQSLQSRFDMYMLHVHVCMCCTCPGIRVPVSPLPIQLRPSPLCLLSSGGWVFRDQVAVSGGAVRAGFGGSESGIKSPSLVLLVPCRAPCSVRGGVRIFRSQSSETKYFVFVAVVAVIIVVSVRAQLGTPLSTSISS